MVLPEPATQKMCVNTTIRQYVFVRLLVLIKSFFHYWCEFFLFYYGRVPQVSVAMYYLKFISKAAHYKTLVLIITYMTVKKGFVQVTVVLKQLACFIILILLLLLLSHYMYVTDKRT